MHQPSARRGFTLVELMLVVLIIGILGSIAGPAFSGLRRRATVAEGVTHFRGIRSAADSYFYEKGEYPPSGVKNPPSAPGQLDSFNARLPGWLELGYAIGGGNNANAADGRVMFRYTYTTAAGLTGKREFFVLTMEGDIDRDANVALYREFFQNKDPYLCPIQTGDLKEGRYVALPLSCP